MNKLFFTIECNTNMHVGSGKANYGVVDQLVQRDPTSNNPVIHASSLKGAIKEYCHHNKYNNMVKVFGSTKVNGKTDHENSQIGDYKFFDAHLLALPVRCDKNAYVHITCPQIIDHLASQFSESGLATELNHLSAVFNSVGQEINALSFSEKFRDATIEDFDVKATVYRQEPGKASILTANITKLFKYDFVVVRDSIFNRLSNDLHLPVIARNYLENGESQNLWYEQVVPRLSRFWSMVFYSDTDCLFEPVLFDKPLVQIGANGSVGYGYCSFSKMV